MKILVTKTPITNTRLSFEEMKKEHGVYQQMGEHCHDGDLVVNSHLGLFYVNLKGDNQITPILGDNGDFEYVKTNRAITVTFQG